MKTKYVIGLLAGLLLIAALLTAGYQISYRHVMDRQAAAAEEKRLRRALPQREKLCRKKKSKKADTGLASSRDM